MTFLGIAYNTDIQLFSRLYDRKMRNQITEAFTHFGRQKALNYEVKFPINICTFQIPGRLLLFRDQLCEQSLREIQIRQRPRESPLH